MSDSISNGSVPEGDLTYESILNVMDEMKSIGPVFTTISMPKAEYDALVATVDHAGIKIAGINAAAGVRVYVNSDLPAHMICAYDTEGNLWVMDLRAPENAHNLGKSGTTKLPFDDFFRP